MRRAVTLAAVVLLCASLVFVYVHFGPSPPVEETAGDGASIENKKEAFGLYRPIWVQYGDYLTDMATLEFGEVWSSRFRTESVQKGPSDVNTLLEEHGARTLWLWGWTLVVGTVLGLPLGLLSGLRAATGTTPSTLSSSAGGERSRRRFLGSAVLRAAPAVLLAPLVAHVLVRSRQLLFGWNWTGWLVDTRTLYGPLYFEDLAVATKLVIPPALAMSVPFVATAAVVGRHATLAARSSGHVDAAIGAGLPPRRIFRHHVLRNALLPLSTTLRRNAAALVGATIVVERVFSLEGAGSLFYLAVTHGDYTTLQALLFVLFCFLAGVALLQDVLGAWLGGERTGRERRARACWTTPETGSPRDVEDGSESSSGLRSLRGAGTEGSLCQRIRADPRPISLWVLAGGLLFALQLGAVLDVVGGFVGLPLPDVPTLLDRSNLPNQGYYVPGEGWQGTAFGLSPALALLLRVGLVGVYAFGWAAWVVAGWRLYRSRYRLADRTPLDTTVRQFVGQRTAVLALVVVVAFFVTALFAPTLTATPIERTETHAELQQMPITEPNESAQLTYFDEEEGRVRSSTVGFANTESKSDGRAETNVGVLSYDDFDRYHPLGTTSRGTDLYSEMVASARVYAVVGGVGTGLAVGIALALVLVATRLRGRIEGAVETVASAVDALPQLVVLFLLLEGLDRTVVHDAKTLLVLMAVLFGVLGWTNLWRTLRTPAYRALDAAWTDRRRLLGRRPIGVIRGGRRLAGILLAYASATFAGVLLTTTGFAALSETIWITTRVWGDLYLYDLEYLTSVSGHTAVVPGVATVVLIASAIVLADGLRRATRVGRDIGTAAPGEAATLGGGG